MSKWSIFFGAVTAVFIGGYVFERKRRCVHHAKAACEIGQVMAGESTEGCDQKATKECRLFGLF